MNSLKERCVLAILGAGMTVTSASSFIHPTAVIEDGAQIGPDVKIWHFTHVMPGARIGEKSKLGQNVFVDQGVIIGRNVKIQNHVSVYRGVTVADDVFIGPSAVFTNVARPRASFPADPSKYAKTRVGEGATIGANATIVCGIAVGEYAFIGAGSVATKNIPPHALVYGNPARQHGWMCFCGEKLPRKKSPRKTACPGCGRAFSLTSHHCKPLS